MRTSQIELSDQQANAIQTISQQTGKTEQEILSQAIAQFISHFQSEHSQLDHRQGLLRQARGMWKERDLSALTSYRNELDRFDAPEP